jgi:hypothetical protein
MRAHSVLGSWLTNDSDEGAFALWAETSEAHANVCAPQHSFALSARDLRYALKEISALPTLM